MKPSPSEYRDLEPEQGPPCGRTCAPWGCGSRHCWVDAEPDESLMETLADALVDEFREAA